MQQVKRELTGVALGEDGDQPLDGPEDGSVDDDGGLLLALVVHEGQPEPGGTVTILLRIRATLRCAIMIKRLR